MALLLTAGLVIVSPIWHRDHDPVPHLGAPGESDLHLCSTGDHATAPPVCPICLSQRVLAQSTTVAPTQLVGPSSGAGADLPQAVLTTIAVSELAQPRAPPQV